LESFGETLTVIELREKLRKIDLDGSGKMALAELVRSCLTKAN
jgi:Ca2+-binding EF-hand superfamily protein